MSDKIYIENIEGKVNENNFINLPSLTDYGYRSILSPYVYQNINNNDINNNESIIKDTVLDGISGAKNNRTDALHWIRVIGDDVGETFEISFLNKLKQLIINNYQIGNVNIFDNIHLNSIITFFFHWNGLAQKYFGIWYLGENIPEDFDEHNISNYMKIENILKITTELGLSLEDINNIKQHKDSGVDYNTHISNIIKDCNEWSNNLKKLINYYNILYNSLSNADKENYLFINENKSIFDDIEKTYLTFNITNDYFGDLLPDIEFSDIKVWAPETEYELGTLVFKNDTDNKIYRCINKHNSSNKETLEQDYKAIVQRYVENGTGKIEKINVVIDQWELADSEYSNEIETLKNMDKNFDKSKYYRFVLNPLESINQGEYDINGELMYGSLEGTIGYNINGYSLRTVQHKEISSTNIEKIANDYLEANPEDFSLLVEILWKVAILRAKELNYDIDNSIGRKNIFRNKLIVEGKASIRRAVNTLKTIDDLISISDDNKEIITMALTSKIQDIIILNNQSEDFFTEDIFITYEDYYNIIETDYERRYPDKAIDKYLIPQGEGENNYYQNWQKAKNNKYNSVTSNTNVYFNTTKKTIFYINKADLQKKNNMLQCLLDVNLKTIDSFAFEDRKDLIKVILGKTITFIGNRAFGNCQNLKHIILSKNLTYLGEGAFASCSSLKRATLPQGITELNGTYIGCSELQSVVLSNNCTTLGANTFSNCSKLKKVYNIDNIITLGQNVFTNCSLLTNFTINNGVTIIPARAFKNCSNCNFIFGNQLAIQEIGDEAFAGCEQLTSVCSFSHLITNLGDAAFKNCKKLEEINFNFTNVMKPKDEKSNNYIIPKEVCYGCTKLKTVIWAKNNNVDIIEELQDKCFENCTSLEEIQLPTKENNCLSIKKMGKNIFAGCTFLKLIKVPKYNYNKTRYWNKDINIVNGENKNNWYDNMIAKIEIIGE